MVVDLELYRFSSTTLQHYILNPPKPHVRVHRTRNFVVFSFKNHILCYFYVDTKCFTKNQQILKDKTKKFVGKRQRKQLGDNFNFSGSFIRLKNVTSQNVWISLNFIRVSFFCISIFAESVEYKISQIFESYYDKTCHKLRATHLKWLYVRPKSIAKIPEIKVCKCGF